MTDIHAHILPRFDDGPQSLDESAELVKSCTDKGIGVIVSTSHYYSSRMPYEEFADRRKRRIAELETELEKKNIDVKIIPAAEVNISDILLNLGDISGLCFGNSRYILLEIPHEASDFEKYFGIIERIVSYYNVIPVIAHIERYRFFLSCPKNIDRLKEIGCLIQIDAQALKERSFFKKRKILSFIKNGKADIIASDCHGGDRPQNLPEAYEIISKSIGERYVGILKQNADTVAGV